MSLVLISWRMQILGLLVAMRHTQKTAMNPTFQPRPETETLDIVMNYMVALVASHAASSFSDVLFKRSRISS